MGPWYLLRYDISLSFVSDLAALAHRQAKALQESVQRDHAYSALPKYSSANILNFSLPLSVSTLYAFNRPYFILST